ncbi:MAG TPA: hypothetical protein VF579_13860 [Candidatus Methylomirabilis sp.]
MDAKLKRPYAKPRIERVDLTGEMQTIAACKSATISIAKLSGNPCTKSNACKSRIGS